MSQTEHILLDIIRSVVTNEAALLPENVDWNEVMALAHRQGVTGILFDGVAMLPKEKAPGREILMELLGNTMMMERNYLKHKEAVSRLAKFYEDNGIGMMLMKGYGLSLNWPRPEHRPTGDIDCYNFGSHELADRMVVERLGIRIDNSHHKHSVFSFNGVMVENHYDFLNIHGHKSTAEIEKILKDMVPSKKPAEETGLTRSDIPNVWFPSSRFNSLYLLRHSGEHFASVDMTLRIVLDWAFFIRANSPIDWKWLLDVLDKVGMKSYLAVLDSVCIRYLGFEKALFPDLPVEDSLVERSINDILHPEVEKEHHENTVREIAFRFSRWRRNGWKHDMVFRESRWQSLLTQMWSHVLKPTL